MADQMDKEAEQKKLMGEGMDVMDGANMDPPMME